MFNNYETLNCADCKVEFTGRKPAEGGTILCPECLKKIEIPVSDFKKKTEIPSEVLDELEGGKGEDE